MITPSFRLFDTRFDTKQIFVTAHYRFSLRKYKNKDGKSLIYLDISDKKNRIRLNTELYILPNLWDQKKQRLIKTQDASKKIYCDNANLILDNIDAKLIQIKTHYILRERFLDAKGLIEEFQSNTPEFDFISFYRHHMVLQDVKKQTLKNYKAVLNKLIAFCPEIAFHKIDAEFFQRYRKFHKVNSEVTYMTDIKCIKKFLRIAIKQGISINLDLEDLKVNLQTKSVVYLEPAEVQQLLKYYYNEFINPSHVLPLGYFLFSCYTGLRISDVQKRTRNEILQEYFEFHSVKTDSFQRMKLNTDARKMVEHHPDLFEKKLVDQKINFHLKFIAKICKIDKVLTTHVARHTFATTFYRKTKDIYRLKSLLGHSNIRHTMVYVHMIDGEELEGLDNVVF